MKKIITTFLVVCLFVGNMTGVSFAYDTKSIISNSTYDSSYVVNKKTYKVYQTKSAMGNVEKGTVFVLNASNKVETNIDVLKKVLITYTVKKDSFRKDVQKQLKITKDEILTVKKLKNCIKFMNFQTDIIKAGTSAGKSLMDKLKKMPEAEFKKMLDPRAQLVKFAQGELERSVKEYEKFLNKKISSYDDAVAAVAYLDKAVSYTPAFSIINEWAAKIEKGLTTKNFLSAVTGGWSDKIIGGIDSLVNNSIKGLYNSAKTSITKSFSSSSVFKNTTTLRNNVKKVHDTSKNLKEVKTYINDGYKKIEPYKKYDESKKKILKDKPFASQITLKKFEAAGKRLQDSCKKVDSYANRKVFSTFSINSVKASSTTLAGKGLKDATVKAYVNNKQIGKTIKVDSKGNYKITIPKQKANTTITVKMTHSKYQDASKNIKVSK